MIEYLYNAVKATLGEDIVITAQLDDENITTDCNLALYEDNREVALVNGQYMDGIWRFIIPSNIVNHCGKYWYHICHYGASISCKYNKELNTIISNILSRLNALGG